MTKFQPENNPSPQLHTSEMLQNLLQQHDRETIRLGELIEGLGSRAFGPTLLICALPEALPLPIAGVSAIIGLPLVIFSIQLLCGFSSPRLPRWLANRHFKRKDFEKVVRQILRYLQKFERLIRPRWHFATTRAVERSLGLLFLLLAFVIMLPIPFGNMLPAIALVVMCLGLIEADGVLVVMGAISSIVILAIMTGAIVALFSGVLQFLTRTPR